ncbi:MAG TPA: hypothetical protein VKA26_12705 [Ignavibacteriaceae bacterium]|nr:hypothetical protein [Ignavibacteriaceae bacterium]
MRKFLLPYSLLFLVLAGCSNNQVNQNIDVNGQTLKKLINIATKGDVKANISLGNLINLNLPENSNYNTLKIDSLTTEIGGLYYTVLLEYPNPIYNRFAIYDTSLNLLLNDKSLNGYLTQEKLNTNGHLFIKITEDFTSKDIIKLDRLSLYSIGDTTANLVFRSFIKMEINNKKFTQQIEEVSDDRIKSSTKSNRFSSIRNKSDIFSFNKTSNKFTSNNNIFDNYVMQTVYRVKDNNQSPQITDMKSMWESVGIDPEANAHNSDFKTNPSLNYSLTLSEEWKKFENFSTAEFLSKEFKCTRYLNNTLGATITLIEIPPANSAEDFIKYKLNKNKNGKINRRFTDEIIENKFFIRFVEYSCGSRKILLIIKGSKFTYNNYKDLYDKIIDSFSMDC